MRASKAEQLSRLEFERNRKEMLEHQNVLLAISAILKTDNGQKLFKYLFKTLDVFEVPAVEMEGKILYEYLGHLRAGNSIYKLASEASSEAAAAIMAKIEREKYEDKYEQFRIEQGIDDTGLLDTGYLEQEDSTDIE